MSTDKSNKKEPDNGLYTLLTTGQKMVVDKDKRGTKVVTVLKQSKETRKQTYVTSEMITGWWIETDRLTPCV